LWTTTSAVDSPASLFCLLIGFFSAVVGFEQAKALLFAGFTAIYKPGLIIEQWP